MAFPRIVGKVDRKLLYPSALHYFRARYPVSLCGPSLLLMLQAIFACVVGMAALAAVGQYPGQVTKKTKDTAVLRAIAVVEWTGEEGKPKSSRLVPVTVYDGEALQDGNVYLARPLPLAVAGQVEYELEKNGKPIGLFDIKNAGQEQGSWVGYGSWKPMHVAKAAKPVLDEGGDEASDRPTLHRKKSDSSQSGGSGNGGSGSGSGTDSSAPSAPGDPDRPTLHKKPSGSDTDSAGSEPTPDPDRPTLHNKPNAPPAASQAEPSGGYTDPDRPLLKRGKSSGTGPEVLPSLMGLPQEMQQAVAVSDVRSKPEHPWGYTWANPDDEIKMKESMEAIARAALGFKSPAHSPAKHAASSTKTKAAPQPPTELPPLVDEQFRVFELAYGSGATMVLTARTDGPFAEQKFVTLIAQPDLYGNVLVLLKNVTDGAHLDESPRMRLVDAVDVLADNRGALLFELRGATQRQFALYRVLRGTAEKIFETGGGQYGVAGE
jgi:hypothetical protein